MSGTAGGGGPGDTLSGVARRAAPRHVGPDVALRGCVAVLALGIVAFAAVTDPAGAGGVAVLTLAAGLFVAWAVWPAVPVLLLAAGVLACVVAAKASGGLDAGLFLVSLLAIVVAGWERSRWRVVVVGVAALATPVLLELIRPGDVDVGVWIIGIAFPGIMSRLFRRQEELTAQLEAGRRELADRAAAEERTRIARDVHDLVAHGLAAMLLQVTSARHVLRRDVDDAEVALRSAEAVGRRSLGELRATVALLRGDPRSATAGVPGLGRLPRLVDDARAAGQAVEAGELAEPDAVAPAPGLALYRVAQEALTNAARHAPRTRTVVTTRVHDGLVELRVDSRGPLGPAEPGEHRPGYGLTGMRERATAAGGVLDAGPVPGGWLVRCAVPIGDRTDARP